MSAKRGFRAQQPPGTPCNRGNEAGRLEDVPEILTGEEYRDKSIVYEE
jgi:hypothetical protein